MSATRAMAAVQKLERAQSLMNDSSEPMSLQVRLLDVIATALVSIAEDNHTRSGRGA